MDFLNQFIKTLSHSPLAFSFFLILILLRPVIDIFWWVKDVNTLLSPLNWAGALPVAVILYYLYRKGIRQKSQGEGLYVLGSRIEVQGFISDNKTYVFFVLSSIIIFINAFAIVINTFVQQFSHSVSTGYINWGKFLNSLGISIKLVSFPLVFIFINSIINKDNFDFLLKIFLISTVIPFIMILYELVVGPINPYIPGGRKFERYRGLYADGINYTVYWLIGLMTSAYFYLKNNSKFTFYILLFICTLIAISLFYLNQAVAYFLFGFLFIIILLFVIKKNKYNFFTLTFSLVLVFILIYIPGYSKVDSLYSVDTEIIKGNVEIIHGANGRVRIWTEGIKQLFDKPLYVCLFGAGLSGSDNLKYFSSGAHSDYLRILYSAGLAGLILYLIFVFSLFKGFVSYSTEKKFLLISVTGTLLLFSVTHTPTVYLPFVYFTSVIFGYGVR